ncbi:MAG: septum formation initiator family protein [Candidatus Kapaibacterium sp.]|nr:septum formation initiator family protein [Bacteroidota bacterium]
MSEEVQQSPGAQKNRLKRRRYLSISIIGVAVLAFLLFSKYGVITRFSLERKKTSYYSEIDALRIFQDSLRTDIKKLQYDTLEIERIAREQYGMVKPGEKVFIVKKDEK